MRLDRVIGKWAQWSTREVRKVLASGRVTVDGACIREGSFQVSGFSQVCCDGDWVQNREARYLMLHKPLGFVSATRDLQHKTVIDLIQEPWARELHLAGRLDRFTSGLVILTNDGRFSEGLTLPDQKVGKRYLVTLDGSVTAEVVTGFEAGLWFARENVMTAPAQLECLGSQQCRLVIYEGKHHQVKRMFACFGLRVTALHREAMGAIELDERLPSGSWRYLTREEVREGGVEPAISWRGEE